MTEKEKQLTAEVKDLRARLNFLNRVMVRLVDRFNRNTPWKIHTYLGMTEREYRKWTEDA